MFAGLAPAARTRGSAEQGRVALGGPVEIWPTDLLNDFPPSEAKQGCTQGRTDGNHPLRQVALALCHADDAACLAPIAWVSLPVPSNATSTKQRTVVTAVSCTVLCGRCNSIHSSPCSRGPSFSGSTAGAPAPPSVAPSSPHCRWKTSSPTILPSRKLTYAILFRSQSTEPVSCADESGDGLGAQRLYSHLVQRTTILNGTVQQLRATHHVIDMCLLCIECTRKSVCANNVRSDRRMP